VARKTSARKVSLACGLLVATALLGCQQLVVFDSFPDGGMAGAAGAGGGGGGNQGNGGAGPFCPSGDARPITPFPTPVDVVVALDRSTGMNAKFNDGSTLGSASSEALRTVVSRYEKAVNFALVLFPSPGNCSSDPSCCVGRVSSPTTPGFSFALDSCNTPGACVTTSQRPIAEALDSTYSFYSQNFDPNRYLLLLTSGDPGCGSGPGDNCDDEEFRTYDLQNRIHVWTEVIGVGLSEGGGCLGKLARAGGLAPLASTTTSSFELSAKIDEFVRSIADDACSLDLHPPPGSGDEVAVFQNGMPIPNGGPNGWEFDGVNRSSILLKGTTCDRFLTNGVKELSIKACPDNH
jgi:hypothetical protein